MGGGGIGPISDTGIGGSGNSDNVSTGAFCEGGGGGWFSRGDPLNTLLSHAEMKTIDKVVYSTVEESCRRCRWEAAYLA